MRRRGSPFTGVGVVLAKEAADYLSGARMWLLEALVFLTAIASAYAAILSIRASIGESPFLFLRLLTMAQDPLPSFIALLGFLIPLVAIAIGFDAINGEFNRRTLSRVLAQPIYRDALLLGKFLAGLVALTIGLFSLWLLTIGLGLLLLGLPPNTEEMVRMLGFLVATIAYGGVWLAVAFLFSVVFRAPATASRAWPRASRSSVAGRAMPCASSRRERSRTSINGSCFTAIGRSGTAGSTGPRGRPVCWTSSPRGRLARTGSAAGDAPRNCCSLRPRHMPVSVSWRARGRNSED